MKKYDHVPIDALKTIFAKWKEVLERHEVGNVFFLPLSDCRYRAEQYRDWVGGNVTIIDLELAMVEGASELDDRLRSTKEEMIIVIGRAKFVAPEAVAMAGMIEKCNLAGRGIILMHELVPSEVVNEKAFALPVLNQWRMLYPLYESEVGAGFVKNVDRDWKLNLNNQEVGVLGRDCGGFLWWVTDVLRNVREGVRVNWDHLIELESLAWKVEQVWKQLPESYRELLLGKGGHEEVRQEMAEYRIDKIPILLAWVKKWKQSELVITGEQIKVGISDYSERYSPVEKQVLLALRQNQGEVVKRETLGKVWWGATSAYSDWALDQKMSRLRRKIERDTLPITLKTKKGVGYELVQN